MLILQMLVVHRSHLSSSLIMLDRAAVQQHLEVCTLAIPVVNNIIIAHPMQIYALSSESKYPLTWLIFEEEWIGFQCPEYS